MKSVSTVFTVVALSLAIWVFFYEQSMPLGSQDTVLIVGVSLAAVLLGRFILARVRDCHRSRKKAASA